ncbi:AAA family ATPase [Prevotella scopos JCM 17725]|uniref:AAA domain-containing protein n=1 Tax=Prevotella scopos JCM 17725 TaxID=1236518 RepID=A0AAX2F2G1_9BACT|nr:MULTISPECIES: bifunctional DNA primase/helicase [Prevotella]ANR73680.1 topoisomerase [Prevotella scopos JCM 17725]MBW4770911.1 AAA family ATPase [Prevotella jejuni]QUB44266.1 AAA family ATPase [Prevotella scopos JCM 17725]SHF68734.1 AAA domain-containing protein [Prevotella scopos JCM 17725]
MNIKEEILEHTNRGLEIFCFYMPIDFVPKRNFRNPLYKDKRASCNIYLDTKSQCYRMKDFGNEAYSGDCFWFAATMLGLDVRSDFKKVLLTIIQDLNLNITMDFKTDENRKTKSLKDIRLVSSTSTNAKEELSEKKKIFKLYEQPFRADEIAYWQRYGITDKVLQKYHVKSLFRYETISNQGNPFSLTSTKNEPIFCYVMGDFVKIYRPNSKLRFLYGGDKSKDYIFGFEQLPSKGDILFITGGEKDVLSLSSHHFNAICFNSETASIPEPIIESLQLRFRHIILLYDTDETGLREAERQAKQLEPYHVFCLSLSLQGTKTEKDISDFFALGKTAKDLTSLLTDKLSSIYTHTIMMLQSCEIDYENPPDASKSIVAVNGVPLGTQDNLLCITGGEGTGKSNYVAAILTGTLGTERLPAERTLGLEITPNPNGLAVLHYDTEQSEAQLHKNLGKTLQRASLKNVPKFYHSLYLASLSRKDRLKLIRESMDLFYHKHGGIHLVVIDGIADLIRSANDETESIAIVDELYRLAGIYNTCIICVLHFVPNGIKLRGHIGSELQRKAAGILSIEKDDNPEYSVVKALKVRDGSPLDVPMMLFGWDKAEDMHVYRGEKSKEDKEKRKTDELIAVVKETFRNSFKLTYQELCEVLMRKMEIKDRTAKKYIAYMKEQHILIQDTSGNYQKGELCHT